MGTLLNPRREVGGMDCDSGRDTDMAPLLRWALREQVHGMEPDALVWQGVQGKVAGRQSHRVQGARHFTTVVSAVIVAFLVLTMGMVYSVDEQNMQFVTVPVQPTMTVEPAQAGPVLPIPIVVASSVMRVLPLPRSGEDAIASGTSVAEQPRLAQPVDMQDDALKPVHKLRVTLLAPVTVQPGTITVVVIKGEPPKPM